MAHGSPYGLWDLPLTRLCSYIWWFALRNAEPAERTRFEARLWMPPKENTAPIPAQSPWSAESEMKAFAALKAETGA